MISMMMAIDFPFPPNGDCLTGTDQFFISQRSNESEAEQLTQESKMCFLLQVLGEIEGMEWKTMTGVLNEKWRKNEGKVKET